MMTPKHTSCLKFCQSLLFNSWANCNHASQLLAQLGHATYAAHSRSGLVLLSLLCAAGTAQAVSVNEGINMDPAVCPRFLATLRQDHILDMTASQFCRYDFMQRHGGTYYQRLDWKPVLGDPVALTMKIYDATAYAPIRSGVAKTRADFLVYAQEQNRHHGLSVDVAPIILAGGTKQIHAYVLRSRGSYCANADILGDSEDKSAISRVLIAFFRDKDLQNPIPEPDRTVFYERSYPLSIDGRNYVVGLDTRCLYHQTSDSRCPYRRGGFGGGAFGSLYSADLGLASYMTLGSQLRSISMGICRYTILKNATK